MEILRHSNIAGINLVLADNGKFQVLSGDEVLVVTGVESYAEIAYEEAVDERTKPLQERQKHEQARREVSAVRQSSLGKASRVTRKGGPSGR